MAYQGRPGRFTTSTVGSVEDQSKPNRDEQFKKENDDPRKTALIVRHQTDYPYGTIL